MAQRDITTKSASALEHLGPKAIRIHTFITEYRQAHAYGPSIRDIAAAVGISSTSQVAYHLDALERCRLIDRDAGIARSIRIRRAA